MWFALLFPQGMKVTGFHCRLVIGGRLPLFVEALSSLHGQPLLHNFSLCQLAQDLISCRGPASCYLLARLALYFQLGLPISLAVAGDDAVAAGRGSPVLTFPTGVSLMLVTCPSHEYRLCFNCSLAFPPVLLNSLAEELPPFFCQLLYLLQNAENVTVAVCVLLL